MILLLLSQWQHSLLRQRQQQTEDGVPISILASETKLGLDQLDLHKLEHAYALHEVPRHCC